MVLQVATQVIGYTTGLGDTIPTSPTTPLPVTGKFGLADPKSGDQVRTDFAGRLLVDTNALRAVAQRLWIIQNLMVEAFNIQVDPDTAYGTDPNLDEII